MTDRSQTEIEHPSFMGGNLLEYEDRQVRDSNPVPDVHSGIPFSGEDRRPIVPVRIKEYLQKRYGDNVEVDFGNTHGESDASGYSYRVLEGGRVIAQMGSVKKMIDILPPNYEGPLTDVMDKHRNEQFLAGGVRKEGLTRVMWRIQETPRAIDMRVEQFKKLQDSKSS